MVVRVIELVLYDVVKLCVEALTYDGKGCSELLQKIADVEEQAYEFLV